MSGDNGLKSSARHISMSPLDELFSAGGGDAGQVQNIPLSDLHDFNNHPFKVLDDESMQEMAESIKASGVLLPGLARLRAQGGYELVAGHRRKRGCELAGLDTMPVIVRDLSDDEAVIIMVDSNIQRETLLPSEKAWAYKMKLDAMKRQGQRSDLTSDQLGRKSGGKESREILAEQVGESKNQISRFIRLTGLIPPLLEMVDSKSFAVNPAVAISYLPRDEQEQLLTLITQLGCTPSLTQAEKMKQYSVDGKLNAGVIEVILSEENPQPVKVTIKSDRLKKYFPAEYTPAQMETVIIGLLDEWREKQVI